MYPTVLSSLYQSRYSTALPTIYIHADREQRNSDRKNEMGIGVTWYILTQFGHALNYVVSFAIFCILDLFDAFLFIIYKLLDYAIESECKPCYCFSNSNDTAASKIQLEDISDTLHSRRSFVSQFTRKTNAAFFTVVPPFLDMFQSWTKGKRLQPVCRWSDCDCMTCNSWSSCSSTARGSLFVHVEGSEGKRY